MKQQLFFRHLGLKVLFLLCLLSSVAYAQQPPQPCHITITSDFESLCLMPLDKDSVYNEEPGAIIACQENTVTYTATSNTSGVSVVSWSWSVVGASTWIDNGNGTITVTWGNGTFGQISVTITTANDYSCSMTQNVKLIEKPTILVNTVPAYTEMPNGDKIIYVCKDDNIEFTDLSYTTNSDIVGYFWECDNPTSRSSSQNFRVENVLDECKVTHRVYNNCGCYDEEVYLVKVLEGEKLNLSCYGTVCHNATVTYTAESPACDEYSWYVEGGHIVSGQDQQTVTVQWGNPQNGYGIIGLDGFRCGQNTCPSMLSKKIPIISDSLTINGQEVACVDEAVIYSIPLFGSTEYHWDVQPSTGADMHDVNGANQTSIVFTQPGTYQITVSYKCEFLECGTFTSKPLTVYVRPKLAIDGEDRICITNSCDLKTEPNVPALWRVFDIDNNVTINTTPNTTNFSYHFLHPGKYRITAENPNFCRPAVFVITVVAAPPAPTSADFDPNNPTVACKNSAIYLKANPTNPDYSIIWEPSCSNASPQSVSGNEVTINYGNTVCNINAYNYDRVLGCLSENPYPINISQFQLAPHGLPSNITVCPGAVLSWNVPYQDGVIYEWILENNNQHCASIQNGTLFDNSISLLINELTSYPQTFTLKLKREYCSNLAETRTIHITVTNNLQSTITIDDPGQVCQNTNVQLNGTGCNGNGIEWHIEDNILHGSPVNYTFHHAGSIPVTLICNPYYSCPNTNYYASSTILVNVDPEPPVTGIALSGTSVHVVPLLSTSDYDFDWEHTPVNNNTVIFIPGQYDYTCTVTDKQTGCHKNITANVQPCINTLTVSPYSTYNYCTKEISFKVDNATNNITWNISGGRYSVVSTTGLYGDIITIRMIDAGNFTITAKEEGDPCKTGSRPFTIDFVPDFTLEKACSNIIIRNHSRYIDGSKMVTIKYNTIPRTFRADVTSVYIPTSTTLTTYNFVLTKFDINNLNCPLGDVTIQNTTGTPVSISLPNGTNPLYQTCHNTPIQLTASLPSPHTVVTSSWNFGDGSSSSHSNPIHHTFDENEPNYYTVTVNVTDENACSLNGSTHVYSNHNDLKPEFIYTVGNIQCKDDQRDIYFDPHYSDNYYNWSPDCYPTNQRLVSVYHTGDYSVEVSNDLYCKVKKSRNIPFKNKPTAVIVTASSVYCAGETIKFFGSPDPDSNSYQFDWLITDITSGNSVNYHYATISYTPSHAGTYTVSLSITNSEGCSGYTTESIYVNPTPSEPSIYFNTNECLHLGAVELSGTTSTTPPSVINWSNGYTGPNARYHTPGEARAWYYDINTGCKSKEAKIHIEPQPDFDALLTGCYEKCPQFFETHHNLPVWGLSSGREEINWKWYLDNNNIDGNTAYYPGYFISPLLNGFGTYYLDLDYHNGACGTLTSPTLSIEPTKFCDCDGLEITYYYDWWAEDCRLFYKVEVTVCNTSIHEHCLDKLEFLFDEEIFRIIDNDFQPNTVASNGCYTFHMTIEAAQFIPSSTIMFRIIDNCLNCTKDFGINLMPEKFECEMEMSLEDIIFHSEWCSHAAAYFDFGLNVNPSQNLIAFWSEPSMIIDYWYDGADFVRGLGMVDFATLSQLASEDGMYCFYAITCEDNMICKRFFCIPAQEILDRLREMGIDPESEEFTHRSSSIEIDADPFLYPNPTTGLVNVDAPVNSVQQILIFDINGRQMASFLNSTSFDISSLPTGVYFVRISSKQDNGTKVTYHKLVKK